MAVGGCKHRSPSFLNPLWSHALYNLQVVTSVIRFITDYVFIMFIMVLILLLIIMMMKLMITHRRPSVVMSTEVSDSLRWGDTRHSKSIKITTIVIWLKMPKIIFGKARWRCRRVCVNFQAGCANFLLLCGRSMFQTLAIANWALALVQEFVY